MNKILVIEDELPVRLGIVELLNEEGYETIAANDGRQGIELAQLYQPDLIISDVLMPNLDGYSVFKELQKELSTSSIPFIFLSVLSENSDVNYGINLGAAGYLTKPYKANDLLAAVKSRLSNKKYIDEKFETVQLNITKSLPNELITPMVSILGFSQIIMERNMELGREEILEMVAKINKAGSNLNKIIQKFILCSELEIIKNDKNKKKHYRSGSAVTAKNEIFSSAQSIIYEHRRELDVDFKLEDAYINITSEFLQFITEELVDNACRFSEPGSKILIYSRIENDNYILDIKDYGMGISDEQLKEIGLFRQFGREKYLQQGLGLSLTIIHRILILYNGYIRIVSEKDKFTTATVTFKIV